MNFIHLLFLIFSILKSSQSSFTLVKNMENIGVSRSSFLRLMSLVYSSLLLLLFFVILIIIVIIISTNINSLPWINAKHFFFISPLSILKLQSNREFKQLINKNKSEKGCLLLTKTIKEVSGIGQSTGLSSSPDGSTGCTTGVNSMESVS